MRFTTLTLLAVIGIIAGESGILGSSDRGSATKKRDNKTSKTHKEAESSSKGGMEDMLGDTFGSSSTEPLEEPSPPQGSSPSAGNDEPGSF